MVNKLIYKKTDFCNESFHYISANFKVFEQHDLSDFFHICIADSHLKIISIECRFLKKCFTGTVLEISLFKVLHFCH